MQTALGGAGLAVAFNAPIAGTLFTPEEVTKAFRTTTVLAAIFASSAAVGCPRLVLGDHREFHWEIITQPGFGWLPLFVVFGLLDGRFSVRPPTSWSCGSSNASRHCAASPPWRRRR